jgi:hypothetical protein
MAVVDHEREDRDPREAGSTHQDRGAPDDDVSHDRFGPTANRTPLIRG